MSSSDRRVFLLSFLALGACGFAPVYGPGGSAAAIEGQLRLDDPETQEAYFLNRRIEERLGRAPNGRFVLSVKIGVEQDGFGTTSDGRTLRYRLTGRAAYKLRDAGTGALLSDRETVAFTGYSASGSNVATLAGRRDATERLMVILADQIIDQLYLLSPDLPQ